MPSPRLDQAEFKRRFLEQYIDPAFDGLSAQLESVAAAAWDAYADLRKSPRVSKAGSGFSDPDYELSLDWLKVKRAILDAESRRGDETRPSRILLINCSSRSEHTCPGEMSKSWRLLEIAQEIFQEGDAETEILNLSRLASEYGRKIHPCKACFSTSAALCPAPAIRTTLSDKQGIGWATSIPCGLRRTGS